MLKSTEKCSSKLWSPPMISSYSLFITMVSRGFLIHLLYEDSPVYCLPPSPPLFFKFWSTSPPNTLTIILTARYILHNDVMDRHKLNLSTFVPQGSCGVFYGIRFELPEVYFADSWFDIIQTKTHNTHGPIDWHNHINIY